MALDVLPLFIVMIVQYNRVRSCPGLFPQHIINVFERLLEHDGNNRKANAGGGKDKRNQRKQAVNTEGLHPGISTY